MANQDGLGILSLLDPRSYKSGKSNAFFKDMAQGVTKLVKDKAASTYKGMDTMDKAALATAPIPVVGDVVGLANDARYLAKEPTMANAGLMALGALPMVPSLGIIKRAQVNDLKIKKATLPDNEIFADAVKNTKGASIQEDGLLINLERYQQPEQAGAESVRTGTMYLPQGDKNAKYYRSSKNTYGGSEKISGETLYKNPYLVKGATGGKAPEQAIKDIIGEDNFELMQKDIMEVLMGNRNEEAVSSVLKKWGGDPDSAWNIIQNANKGNQKRYAIQENIAANLIRNKGYDAILGYSKRKDGGHFISEVFDLRESYMPVDSNEIGGIHPSFYQDSNN